jgi:hypothetical protein
VKTIFDLEVWLKQTGSGLHLEYSGGKWFAEVGASGGESKTSLAAALENLLIELRKKDNGMSVKDFDTSPTTQPISFPPWGAVKP